MKWLVDWLIDWLIGSRLMRMLSLLCERKGFLFINIAGYGLRVAAKRRLSFLGLRVGLFPVSDRKSTRLNSSHSGESRMPSSA